MGDNVKITIYWEDGSTQIIKSLPKSCGFYIGYREGTIFDGSQTFADCSLNMKKALRIFSEEIDE